MHSMALNPADVGLAGTLVTVSVTFSAVYMALYIFVFADFQSSSVAERLTRGTDYYAFFREGTALAIVALIIEQEWPLVPAIGVFFSEFIFGTLLIIQQAGRVGQTALPYAATEWVIPQMEKDEPR